MDKQQMYEYLKEEKPVLTNLSDRIWGYAETAFEEFQSVALIQDVLRNHDFTMEAPIGKIKTAFCGTYGSSRPAIGILAEFDALNSLSQKAHNVVQQPLVYSGNGHGCGHNLFAGGSMGTVLAVKTYLEANHLSGTIKLFGCPGEKGGSGKVFMAQEGMFQGIDVALAWHPMEVDVVLDIEFLANYQVLYTFKGKAMHTAAASYLGRSALDAVEPTDVDANYLQEHVISDARIHYATTNSGGSSPNVVQSLVSVLYLTRALKTSQVEEICQRID